MIKKRISKNIFLASIVITILIVGIVYAYGGTQPQLMGHSVGEINWSETIPQVNAQTLNATNRICLSGNCQTSWPLSNIDPNFWQTRVTGECPVNEAIIEISMGGYVTCQSQVTVTRNYRYETNCVAGSGTCSCSGGYNLVSRVSSQCDVTADSGTCTYSLTGGSCCVCGRIV